MTGRRATPTTFELTVRRAAVLFDRLARNVPELWHAMSFLLELWPAVPRMLEKRAAISGEPKGTLRKLDKASVRYCGS